MILNNNFDHDLESIINTCQPLASWFSRNQDQMAYLELTKPGCLHLEGTYATHDIIVLGRMASAALIYLSSKDKNLSSEEKAMAAAFAIFEIYERERKKYKQISSYKISN